MVLATLRQCEITQSTTLRVHVLAGATEPPNLFHHRGESFGNLSAAGRKLLPLIVVLDLSRTELTEIAAAVRLSFCVLFSLGVPKIPYVTLRTRKSTFYIL